MAAPAYNTDLQTINLAETTTGWSAYGGGASGLSASPDLAMEGTNCVDKQVSNADKGQYVDSGTGITLSAGEHIWIWHFCGTPGLCDTLANKGASVLVGSGAVSPAYCQYHTDGGATYGASGRVGKCHTIDYTVRTAKATPPNYRTVTGTPAANPNLFGGGLVTTASVKGANVGIDGIRRGSGLYLTAGELISAGDASDNPLTFEGARSTDDTSRLGALISVAGAYELQGRFVIGQNSSKVATPARFRDSNKLITLRDCFHAAADFTQIILDDAATRGEWTNISIQALGVTVRGRLVVNAANPTFIVNGGTFTDIGITTLRSNTTVNGTTWRNTDTVTLNGASVANAVFDGTFATHHVFTASPSLLTGCDFRRGAAGHAVRCDTAGTYTWNANTDTGYTGTRGSNPTPNSGSTDACFYNNSGGLITLNVTGGGQQPSVRNGAGATTVVNANILVTYTGLVNGSEVRVYNASSGAEIAGTESVTGNQFQWSVGSGVSMDIRIFGPTPTPPSPPAVAYIPIQQFGVSFTGDTSIGIQQQINRNYRDPA